MIFSGMFVISASCGSPSKVGIEPQTCCCGTGCVYSLKKRKCDHCLHFTWLMLDLIHCSLLLPRRVSGALCLFLPHVRQIAAADRGSESSGRPPDPSHRRICMWNRHFTPPHSLIVAKIICEIAFHQECFPRQLSQFYMRGGPTELTPAPLLPPSPSSPRSPPPLHVSSFHTSLMAARHFLTITFK